MVKEQATLFGIFILNGFLIGFLFDFFRILRKSFKTKDLIIYFQDILFWIISGIIIMYSVFIFNNGQIRFYMLVGIIIGTILYLKTFSAFIIKINVHIIYLLKKCINIMIDILEKPFKLMFRVIKKIFFKPINFIIINLKDNLKSKKCNILRNNFKNKVYKVFNVLNKKKVKNN